MSIYYVPDSFLSSADKMVNEAIYNRGWGGKSDNKNKLLVCN